jgi:hypothetical protein
MLVAAVARLDRGQDHPLVEVLGGLRGGQGGQERDEPQRPAQLRGAGGAGADMSGQPTTVRARQLVDEVRVDERAR